MASCVFRALRMRDTRSLALRLAPCAATLAAPVHEPELTLFALGVLHGKSEDHRSRERFAKNTDLLAELKSADKLQRPLGAQLDGVASPRETRRRYVCSGGRNGRRH